jgi:hypothetical protein
MNAAMLSMVLIGLAVLASLAFAFDMAWSYLGRRGRYATLGAAAIFVVCAVALSLAGK